MSSDTARQRSTTVPAPATRRLRIFVADDDPDMRHMVAWLLRSDGHEVIEAQDGDDLLDQIGSSVLNGTDYDALDADLIVSDVRMPGWNGLAILTGLRHAGWKLPVILMTAFPEHDTAKEARRLGATLFQKPFEPQTLIETVRHIVTTV
jgi:DNA-binding response OmpR family regulator